MKIDSDMKRIYGITLLSALVVIIIAFALHYALNDKREDRMIKVGFVYVGDASTSYTNNFIKAQKAIEKKYDGQVETIAKYNVVDEDIEMALQELIDERCNLIFTTSYGYGKKTKEYAAMHPDIEFCQATCSNANEEPLLDNYHTFMGTIYQGRYVSGVVAGMKLKELIDNGNISPEQAKIGYVGAFPFAEVISGYTAFFLGVRSIVPNAEMMVEYTNTWSDYYLEKESAKRLIDRGCVIISQHSDTSGPAAACEETDSSQVVYYVSYNESMKDVAPTTYLTGSRINWEPYITAAVGAVLSEKDIEKCVKGNVNQNDIGSGFEEDWVRMLEINELVVAEGTQEKVDELINGFKQNRIVVFQGDYKGINPYDDSDIIDLKEGYYENKYSSAPAFNYVLQDIVIIE